MWRDEQEGPFSLRREGDYSLMWIASESTTLPELPFSLTGPSCPAVVESCSKESYICETIARLRPYIADMRTRFALTLLLSFVFLASGTSRATDLALTGAKVYPSPTDPPIENGSILIRDGHILAVGPSQTIKIPRVATVIDCKGLVVTAGFWNNHVHILTPALLHVRDSSAKQLDEQLDTMFNRWGFTTVFDISSLLDNTLAL